MFCDDPSNVQKEKKQSEVLTEKQCSSSKASPQSRTFKDELQQIKMDLVCQPVWTQSLSVQELRDGGFGGSILFGRYDEVTVIKTIESMFQ